jgi:hypothetical protein
MSVLDRLPHDSSMPVRREALAILAEQFPDRAEETWTRLLLDRSAPIRELARFHLARLGIRDLAARYRNAVLKTSDSLAVIGALSRQQRQSTHHSLESSRNTGTHAAHRFPPFWLDSFGGLIMIADPPFGGTIGMLHESPSSPFIRFCSRLHRPWLHFPSANVRLLVCSPIAHGF